jgi:hypothetical protein
MWPLLCFYRLSCCRVEFEYCSSTSSSSRVCGQVGICTTLSQIASRARSQCTTIQTEHREQTRR